MTLLEALSIVQAASSRWSEYLDDGSRDAQCEQIDAAGDVLDEFVRLLGS